MTDTIDIRTVDALFDDAWAEVTKAQKERDELRAELAEERAARENAEVMWEEHARQNRELRAENEAARIALKDADAAGMALIKENERLTLADRQWADHVKRLSEENERLKAEIGPLKERLADVEAATDLLLKASLKQRRVS